MLMFLSIVVFCLPDFYYQYPVQSCLVLSLAQNRTFVLLLFRPPVNDSRLLSTISFILSSVLCVGRNARFPFDEQRLVLQWLFLVCTRTIISLRLCREDIACVPIDSFESKFGKKPQTCVSMSSLVCVSHPTVCLLLRLFASAQSILVRFAWANPVISFKPVIPSDGIGR